jgi:outer membrane receptor protein involved in Fe transport
MNFTGVPASQSDPTGHSAKMRGMGNVKVLVLLDGVPIHDPFYLTIQWFKVPLSNIERVEVVRGGNSSLWGNMAAAGMINIISRRAKGSAGEASASMGSKGSSNLTLSKNFAVSDALGFTLAIDQFHTDGYQTTPAEYLWRFAGKGTADAKNTNVQLTAHFQPASDLKGYFRIGYHVQDQELNYQFGRNLQSSPDVAVSLTKDFDKGSNITANAWAQEVKFEKYNGASCYWQAAGTKCPATTAVTAAQVNSNIVQYYTQYGSLRYHERGGSVTYSKTMNGRWSSFQFGADYRNLWATDLEYFYLAPTALTMLQNLNASTLGKGEQTFKGLFGQTKVLPLDALEVTLSGRYDTFRYSNRNNTRTTAAGVTTGGAILDSTKNAFSPSIAARYEVNNQLALRGAAYKAFRAPGFNNITRTFGTGTSTTIANPDLEPETLKGWELGTDYNSGSLALGATYFLYNITKMIGTYTVSAASASIPAAVTAICGTVGGAPLQFLNCSTTSAATSVKYYTNDQDGQSHGVELTGSWKVRNNLTLDATYTKTETYLTRRGSVVTDPLGVQLVGVPKDVVSLGATWKPDDKLRTYAELRYIGPMLIDTTSVANTSFGQGGFTVFSASASYAWDKTTELFASAVNLFDKQYSENAYTYTQPYSRTLSQPRTLNVGVKVRF